MEIHAGGSAGELALDNVMQGIAFHFNGFQELRRDGALAGVIVLRGVQAPYADRACLKRPGVDAARPPAMGSVRISLMEKNAG